MSTKKSTTIYRIILRESFAQTWQRKSLWVFGLFAGLISTGGVIDIALHSIQNIKHGGVLVEHLLDRSFFGYHLFAAYLSQMSRLGASRVGWILVACTIALVGLIAAGIVSQIALILNSASAKPKHALHLREEAAAYFWRVFTLGALTKIASFVLTVVASLPFALYILNSTAQTFWIVFFHTLIFLPLVIILNLLSMLALIDLVDNNSRVLDAVATAIRLFRKQWVATLEFAFLLFLVVLFAGFVLLMASSILLIPYTILYTSAIFTGSITIFLTSNVILALLFLAFILTFAGAIVMFQYTAWHRFYKRAMHKQHGAKFFSKLLRWLHV